MGEWITRLYYLLIYRRLMKFMHRHGWHYMRHHPSYFPDGHMPHGHLKCDWCGITSDVPYSMRLAKGPLPPPPEAK